LCIPLRRTQVDEFIDGVQRSVSYQYDATGKLLTETILQAGQRSSIAYTYDAMGNRLTNSRMVLRPTTIITLMIS